MSLSGMGESMCLEGATDAKAFKAYVEHFLAPLLSKGQVVVIDNLDAHRPKRIRELIEARGAELVFVPSYSPDLNPIEQAFSKIKNVLRKLGARTHEAQLVGALVAPFGAATHLLTCSEYATVEHHLEDAPAAVEAALIEVRRRVRPNEGW